MAAVVTIDELDLPPPPPLLCTPPPRLARPQKFTWRHPAGHVFCKTLHLGRTLLYEPMKHDLLELFIITVNTSLGELSQDFIQAASGKNVPSSASPAASRDPWLQPSPSFVEVTNVAWKIDDAVASLDITVLSNARRAYLEVALNEDFVKALSTVLKAEQANAACAVASVGGAVGSLAPPRPFSDVILSSLKLPPDPGSLTSPFVAAGGGGPRTWMPFRRLVRLLDFCKDPSLMPPSRRNEFTDLFDAFVRHGVIVRQLTKADAVDAFHQRHHEADAVREELEAALSPPVLMGANDTDSPTRTGRFPPQLLRQTVNRDEGPAVLSIAAPVVTPSASTSPTSSRGGEADASSVPESERKRESNAAAAAEPPQPISSPSLAFSLPTSATETGGSTAPHHGGAPGHQGRRDGGSRHGCASRLRSLPPGAATQDALTSSSPVIIASFSWDKAASVAAPPEPPIALQPPSTATPPAATSGPSDRGSGPTRIVVSLNSRSIAKPEVQNSPAVVAAPAAGGGGGLWDKVDAVELSGSWMAAVMPPHDKTAADGRGDVPMAAMTTSATGPVDLSATRRGSAASAADFLSSRDSSFAGAVSGQFSSSGGGVLETAGGQEGNSAALSGLQAKLAQRRRAAAAQQLHAPRGGGAAGGEVGAAAAVAVHPSSASASRGATPPPLPTHLPPPGGVDGQTSKPGDSGAASLTDGALTPQPSSTFTTPARGGTQRPPGSALSSASLGQSVQRSAAVASTFSAACRRAVAACRLYEEHGDIYAPQAALSALQTAAALAAADERDGAAATARRGGPSTLPNASAAPAANISPQRRFAQRGKIPLCVGTYAAPAGPSDPLRPWAWSASPLLAALPPSASSASKKRSNPIEVSVSVEYDGLITVKKRSFFGNSDGRRDLLWVHPLLVSPASGSSTSRVAVGGGSGDALLLLFRRFAPSAASPAGVPPPYGASAPAAAQDDEDVCVVPITVTKLTLDETGGSRDRSSKTAAQRIVAFLEALQATLLSEAAV